MLLRAAALGTTCLCLQNAAWRALPAGAFLLAQRAMEDELPALCEAVVVPLLPHESEGGAVEAQRHPLSQPR